MGKPRIGFTVSAVSVGGPLVGLVAASGYSASVSPVRCVCGPPSLCLLLSSAFVSFALHALLLVGSGLTGFGVMGGAAVSGVSMPDLLGVLFEWWGRAWF